MNKVQLIVLWIAGLIVSGIFCTTGLKLLDHASHSAETLEMGYPFTLVIGTGWTYIVPTVLIGILIMVTLKKRKK